MVINPPLRLARRAAPAVCLAVAAAGTLAALLSLPAAGWQTVVPSAVSVAVPFLLLAGWPGSRPRLVPAAGAMAAVTALGTVALAGTEPRSMSHVGLMALVEVVMLLLTLFLVARYAAPRAALAVSSALALSESTVMLRVEIAPTVLEVLGQVSFFLLAAGLAGTVGGYLRSLDSRRLRSVHEARKAQRLQLAADLHDFVAHDVSGILVLAQAAQIVAGPGDGPLLPLLQRIEAAGQQALASLDRTVLMLGDSAPAAGSLPADGEGRDRARKSETRPAPYGLADIPALLERFRCSGRTEVALDFPRADEVTAEVPREVAATAHRAVVEALTNVRRHAGHATAVRVSVRSEAPSGESERMLVVSVRNTAPAIDRASAPFTEGRRGGGTGLAGLQERIAALSGILTAGPHGDGGWEVRARLPYPVAASKN